VIATTSPFFRNLGGMMPVPTPASVPVVMTSREDRMVIQKRLTRLKHKATSMATGLLPADRAPPGRFH
jgi:hypothetical protein